MHRPGLHRALWRSVAASDALWQLLPTRNLATLSQGATSGKGSGCSGGSSGSGSSGGSDSGAGTAQKGSRSSAKRAKAEGGSGAVTAAAAAPASSPSISPSGPKKAPGGKKQAAAGGSQGKASAVASSSDTLDAALAQAALRGREEVVLQLAQQGADVNRRGRRGRTPLHQAASEGRVAAVRQLLQLGAAPAAADDDGCTPLMLAAAAGKAGAVEALLQAGTPLPKSSSGSAAVADTAEGSRALCLAAATGHSRSVRLLLAAGADADADGDAPGQVDGARPLHLAARGGHASAVRALAAAGADVEATDSAGSTPLEALVHGWQEARAEQLLSASRALLRAGADPARAAALAAARGLQQLESTLRPAEPAEPAEPAAPAEQQGTGSAGSGSGADCGMQAALGAEPSGAVSPASPVPPVPPSPLPTLDRRSPWFGTLPLPGGSGGAGGLLSDEVLAARWEIPWGALSELQELPRGAGSFAQVYTGKWQRTPVAVKKFTVEERDGVPQLEETMQNLRQEVSVMACLRNHPNIVRFLGVCFDPPAIVMELCGRESLLDLLSKATRDPATARLLSWQRRVDMLLDAARGMLHVHEQGMIHRDLKSPNLLVDGKLTVQVADYSLSVFVDEAGMAPADKVMLSVHPRWLAPEVVSGQPASRSSDVFAFSIIMWELLTWVYPWAQYTGEGAVEGIEAALQRGERPEIPPLRDLPGPRAAAFAGMDAYLELMQRCWAQEPERRPTFHEILDELEAMAEGAG